MQVVVTQRDGAQDPRVGDEVAVFLRQVGEVGRLVGGDRNWYLGGHRSQVFDTNGNGGPTAWCDGRIVGGWCQDDDGRVEVRLLEDVGRSADRALQRRADDLTEWLDGVRISPRFPSPLSKSR